MPPPPHNDICAWVELLNKPNILGMMDKNLAVISIIPRPFKRRRKGLVHTARAYAGGSQKKCGVIGYYRILSVYRP